MTQTDKDWKLKLKYGKLKTPYNHYTVISPVILTKNIEQLPAKPGTAYAGIKIWATDTEEAVKIMHETEEQAGFKINGNIEIFETAPSQPPKQEPFSYGLNFSYYEK